MIAEIVYVLFSGIDPRNIYFNLVSNDAAEFLNVFFLIGGSIGILVLVERWWNH
jgi:hypothetical protein